MANERGSYSHRGRYLEIRRPERLRFTWASAATGETDTEVILSFETIAEGTRVTLVRVGLPDEPAAKRHEGGWQSILLKCEKTLGSGA